MTALIWRDKLSRVALRHQASEAARLEPPRVNR
jgi:hypothetical protein